MNFTMNDIFTALLGMQSMAALFVLILRSQWVFAQPWAAKTKIAHIGAVASFILAALALTYLVVKTFLPGEFQLQNDLAEHQGLIWVSLIVACVGGAICIGTLSNNRVTSCK